MPKKCQASVQVDDTTYTCDKPAHRGLVCSCGDVKWIAVGGSAIVQMPKP